SIGRSERGRNDRESLARRARSRAARGDGGRRARGRAAPARRLARRVLLPDGGRARVYRRPDRTGLPPPVRRGALRRLVLEGPAAVLELGLRGMIPISDGAGGAGPGSAGGYDGAARAG